MLLDDFIQFKSNTRYADGTSHDEVVAPIKQRMAKATLFTLDADAVAMACNVTLSKPSSLLSALPFLRLPFPETFMEWSAQEVRSAMDRLGSPNRPHGDPAIKVERIGFLVRELPSRPGERRRLVCECVRRFRHVKFADPMTDVFAVRLIVTIPDDMPDPADALPSVWTAKDVSSDIKGAFRQYYAKVYTDPYERLCIDTIHDAIESEKHPEMARIARAVALQSGEDAVRKIEEDQIREARMHADILLPALILLNTRNAVETETVPAPEKLNKSRAKKGLMPLVEHRVVKLRLSATQKVRAAAERSGAGGRTIRGTLVRGHFKVRQPGKKGGGGGVYWWNSYARAGYGAVVKSYEVTGKPSPDDHG